METVKQLNYIFSRRQKLNFVILVIVILIGSMLELIGVALVMPLVDVLTNSNQIHSNSLYSKLFELFNIDSDLKFILIFIIALIIVYVVKNAYLLFMYDCQFRFTFNNKKRITLKLMRAYVYRPYEFHLSKNISELQRNMKEDVESLFQTILAVVQMASELLTCILLAIYLIIIDKAITFGILTVLIFFILVFLKSTKYKSFKYGEIARETVVGTNKWTRQSFEGIKEIIIANKQELFLSKVDELQGKLSTTIRKQEVLNVSPRPTFEAITITSLLGVVGIKIYMGEDINQMIPVLSAFAVAAFRLLPSFGRLAGYLNKMMYNRSAITSVYNDLKDVENDIYIKDIDCTERFEFDKSIEIEDVFFAYPNCDNNVLNGLSMSIKKDKSIAIIGASGSGKSTLADMLLGLLEPSKGNILVDGVNINNNYCGWHMLIGYIPQLIYIMDDTIRNNVIFGEGEADDDKIWKALENAQLADFVKNLDEGLDTVVGERGIRLSGGQRQRIGIARALYSNPKILILDEATSALDNETETAVMGAIERLKGSHTMVIIAHRLTTIRNCDEIYEIVDGKAIYRDKSEVLSDIVNMKEETK